MLNRVFTLLFLILCLVPTALAKQTDLYQGNIRVHGLSSFSAEHHKVLSEWIRAGFNATRATLGVYPHTMEVYVYPRKSNQPVPWAHTRRDELESVHLYVDSRFPLDKFVNDWTLYHELSHLALPYLGHKYAWFSEGFASYMQYQIMQQNKVLKGTLTQAYQGKIGPHLRWFNSELSPASIASRMLAKKNYPAGYWGAAWYFVLADRQLQASKGVTLNQVIESYQICCRLTDENMQDLMLSLDALIEDSLFSDLLKRFENDPARSVYPSSF